MNYYVDIKFLNHSSYYGAYFASEFYLYFTFLQNKKFVRKAHSW